MKISRVEFLTTVGTALLGAALSEPAAGREMSGASDGHGVGLADLRQHVNTTFHVTAPGIGMQRLLLTQADDRSVDVRIEQCSAVFTGSGDATLPDGTYEFRHPALGRLDLFIVAMATPAKTARESGATDGAGHTCYEACFSRFRMGRPDGYR